MEVRGRSPDAADAEPTAEENTVRSTHVISTADALLRPCRDTRHARYRCIRCSVYTEKIRQHFWPVLHASAQTEHAGGSGGVNQQPCPH